jgi:plastocyanin domain-containing protein
VVEKRPIWEDAAMRILILCVLAVAVAFAPACAPRATTAGGQRVAIRVTDNGFEPAVVNVKAGQPVTLVVKRVTDQTCATELVMKDRNINQPLPLNREVEITFTPDKPGDLTYQCGMGMFKGTVHVE